MSFGYGHTENDCDRCLVNVGKKNLHKLPFLFLDVNDKSHKDETPGMYEAKRKRLEEKYNDQLLVNILMSNILIAPGYRQFYVCDKCWEREQRIMEKQRK